MFNLIPQAQAACTIGQGGLDLASCLTLGSKSSRTVAEVYGTPGKLVTVITSTLFIVGGMLMLIMIMYAGFMFIQNDIKGKDDARNIMRTAFTGLIVMFIAYWIVKIMETIIGTQIIF